MKWIVSLLAVSLLGCGFRSQVTEFRPGGPTAEEIAAIEARVVMPADASPIDQYLRTYFPENGRIVGHYHRGETTGIRSVPERDRIVLDGGCGVVTVVFDPATATVESVDCNGVA